MRQILPLFHIPFPSPFTSHSPRPACSTILLSLSLSTMAGPICDACRAIDFEKVLDEECELVENIHEFSNDTIHERKLVDNTLDADADRLVQASGSDCPLCQLLASTLCSDGEESSDPGDVEGVSRMSYRLKAFPFHEHCNWAPNGSELGGDYFWTPQNVGRVQDCHILLASRGRKFPLYLSPRYPHSHAEDGYIACLPKNRQVWPFVPRMISETFDHTRAKLWLQICKNTHRISCNEDRGAIPGLKTIDCETLDIVQIENGAMWVALSYVWGHDKSEGSSDDPRPGTFPRGISKTVHDAIEVTKKLGYRYLWVDRHCINQQDEAEKRAAIAEMDTIYRGADLTIVAAAGDDEHFGLPGVGTTKRKKQRAVELDSCTILSTGPDPIIDTQRSRWWSRGWTFQESLLSRRRLIFTEHQSWFECAEDTWMEAVGGLELSISPDRAQWARLGWNLHAHLPLPNQHPLSRTHMAYGEIFYHLQSFLRLIKEYSTRTLTLDADSLNAFAGIGRYFRDLNPPVAHILGIPFVPSTMLPINREKGSKYTFYSLAWFHLKDTTPRRRAHFPSWTWAGWAGRVDWMVSSVLFSVREHTLRQIMRHIQFEVDGHLIPEEDYFTLFDLERWTFPNFDVALCFEAQLVPSSLFLWNTRFGTRAHFSSERLPANPNGWDACTVGNDKLLDRSLSPDCDPPEFVEHLEAGRWACLLLGDYQKEGITPRGRFLLVVEWLDEYTARRVGSVVLNSDPSAYRDFFDNSELSWKSVRII